jgi:hypothetical protein
MAAIGLLVSGTAWSGTIAPGLKQAMDLAAADLYRIQRATSAAGPFTEAGSSTRPDWVDVDAMLSPDLYYYRVVDENAGGTE